MIEAKKGVEIFGGVNNNSHICEFILFVFLKKQNAIKTAFGAVRKSINSNYI